MTQLYLNETIADINPSELIALTFQLNNIGELSNRNGNYSSRINLPLTKNNKRIIDNAQKLDSQSNRPYTVLDCRVFQNGIEIIKKGKAVIQQINKLSFEINIYSGLSSFFDLLEGLTLQDINLSELDHLFDAQDIFDNRNNDWQDGFAYPIIDYGFLPDTGDDVKALELYPSIYYRYIINKIVEAQGYNLQGNILEDEILKGSALAFSKDEFKNGQRFIDENLFNKVQTNSFNVSDSEQGDTSNDVDIENSFILPFSQFTNTQTIDYSVTGQIEITNFNKLESNGASLNIILVVEKNNNPVEFVNINGNGVYNIETDLLSFVLGDTLNLSILAEYSFEAANPVQDASFSLTVRSGTFNVLDVDTTINIGTTVNLEDAVLPDIEQSEFLINVFNQFGIIPISDNETKTLTLLTFKDIYNNRSIGEDWSKKIDVRAYELYSKIGDYAQKNSLLYTEDEGVTRNYNDTLNINDKTLPPTSDLIELEFAGSDEANYFDFDIRAAKILKLIDDNGNIVLDTDTEQRVLYLNQSADFILDWFDENDVFINSSNLFKVGRFRTFLDWQTLKGRYYNELENRILNKAKELIVNVKLNETDIQKVNLSIPVYIDFMGSWFYVNEIKEFTSSSQLTECVLIKL